MNFDPEIHHRRSIRLKGYDYTRPGAYFITLVTYRRDEIFGQVVDGKVVLSALGQVAWDEWMNTAKLRPYVQLFEDEFVVMPNHVHGIIWLLNDVSVDVRAQRRCALTHPYVIPGSLGAIVRAYKSAVTYAINGAQNTRGVSIWQRNYYEHIIRSEVALKNIWSYIDNNPRKWVEDQLHPSSPPNKINHI
jgi:REP element-mobilizing transposase RayT